MSYAKTNLRTVQDSAAVHGLSETQEARFPRADIAGDSEMVDDFWGPEG